VHAVCINTHLIVTALPLPAEKSTTRMLAAAVDVANYYWLRGCHRSLSVRQRQFITDTQRDRQTDGQTVLKGSRSARHHTVCRWQLAVRPSRRQSSRITLAPSSFYRTQLDTVTRQRLHSSAIDVKKKFFTFLILVTFFTFTTFSLFFQHIFIFVTNVHYNFTNDFEKHLKLNKVLSVSLALVPAILHRQHWALSKFSNWTN